MIDSSNVVRYLSSTDVEREVDLWLEYDVLPYWDGDHVETTIPSDLQPMGVEDILESRGFVVTHRASGKIIIMVGER